MNMSKQQEEEEERKKEENSKKDKQLVMKETIVTDHLGSQCSLTWLDVKWLHFFSPWHHDETRRLSLSSFFKV